VERRWCYIDKNREIDTTRICKKISQFWETLWILLKVLSCKRNHSLCPCKCSVSHVRWYPQDDCTLNLLRVSAYILTMQIFRPPLVNLICRRRCPLFFTFCDSISFIGAVILYCWPFALQFHPSALASSVAPGQAFLRITIGEMTEGTTIIGHAGQR
jgi:hypothetical protein